MCVRGISFDVCFVYGNAIVHKCRCTLCKGTRAKTFSLCSRGAVSSTVSCSFIEIFATAVKHKIRATIWNSIERAHTRPFGTTHRVAVATNEHHFWSRQLHTNANETRTPKDHPDKTPERPAGLISNAHHATRRPQKITANSNPLVGRVGWSPCYIYHTLT